MVQFDALMGSVQKGLTEGLSLVKDKWTFVPRSLRNLTGLTAIVTGGEAGIGYETAFALLHMNPKLVVIGVKDLTQGHAAAARMREDIRALGAEPAEVKVWELDLTKFDSVKSFAARAIRELSRIDILVEADEILPTAERRVTGDGWEETLQVNVVSNAALVLLLLPKIRHTVTLPEAFFPHVVIVSSDLHAKAKFPERVAGNSLLTLTYDELQTYDGFERYCTTKLIDIEIVKSLSRDGDNEGIVFAAANPGLTYSNLRNEGTGLAKVVSQASAVLTAKPTEQGARNVVFAAVEKFPSGSYIHLGGVQGLAPFVNSGEGAQTQDKIWKEIKEELRAHRFEI